MRFSQPLPASDSLAPVPPPIFPAPALTYRVLQSGAEVNESVLAHFARNDAAFYPPLSHRGNLLPAYVQSIFQADGRVIVCQHQQRVVAAMGICLNHPDWKHYLKYMAVDEEYRRQGLPEKMLAIATGLFREAGARSIAAITWSTNAASQGFFRKHGFFQTDTLWNARGHGIHTCVFVKVLAPLAFGHGTPFGSNA